MAYDSIYPGSQSGANSWLKDLLDNLKNYFSSFETYLIIVVVFFVILFVFWLIKRIWRLAG